MRRKREDIRSCVCGLSRDRGSEDERGEDDEEGEAHFDGVIELCEDW